jgi:hypothetical protein
MGYFDNLDNILSNKYKNLKNKNFIDIFFYLLIDNDSNF